MSHIYFHILHKFLKYASYLQTELFNSSTIDNILVIERRNLKGNLEIGFFQNLFTPQVARVVNVASLESKFESVVSAGKLFMSDRKSLVAIQRGKRIEADLTTALKPQSAIFFAQPKDNVVGEILLFARFCDCILLKD